jgi:hypothetical protein
VALRSRLSAVLALSGFYDKHILEFLSNLIYKKVNRDIYFRKRKIVQPVTEDGSAD